MTCLKQLHSFRILQSAFCIALAALFAASASAGSASLYVQNGLIACWDGIENAGAGTHDAGATVWKDIVAGYEFSLNNVTVDADRMTFAGTKSGSPSRIDSYGVLSEADTESSFVAAKNGTVEVVYRSSSTAASQVFLQAPASSGVAFGIWNTALLLSFSSVSQVNRAAYTFTSGTVTNCVSVRYSSGSPSSAVANGSALSTSSSSSYWSYPNDETKTYVGARASRENNPFAGSIYCIRLYSRQLTDEEIAANHAIDVKRFQEGNHFDDALDISGAPNGIGSPSPDYGSRTGLSAGAMVAVSCGAQPAIYDGKAYACTGWKLYDANGDVVSNGNETAFTYTHPTPAAYRRLKWQWTDLLTILPIPDQANETFGPCRPELTVSNTLEGTTWTIGGDLSSPYFDVEYVNNYGANTATATVTGKGDYAGLSLVQTFKITATKLEDENIFTTDVTARRREAAGKYVYIFTNAAAAQVSTVKRDLLLTDYLVAGGGGGGGNTAGGGGGAGGVTNVTGIVGKLLSDGDTFTVSVGAGGAGAGGYNAKGSNGKATAFTLGDISVSADGGGGGGSWFTAPGAAGASGGGGTKGGAGGAGTAGIGHDGATAGSLSRSGGGGGAGHAGYQYTDGSTNRAGNGGEGILSSITGEAVYYGGGGGGGGSSSGNDLYYPGFGGLGGGGDGERSVPGHPGTDGLGGGGGGGKRDASNNATSTRNGARGGSGTVIVRWKATASDTAAATIESVTGAVRGAIVTGTVENGSNVTLEMATATAGGALGTYTTLATGLAAGEAFTLALSGLADATSYDYAIRVADGDVSGASTGSFTTLAAPSETSLTVASNASDPTAANVTVALASAGDLSIAYGLAPDALTLSQAVSAGAAPGTYAATVAGLAAGQTWYFAPVVGTTKGEAVAFALPPAPALPAGDGAFGLWQISLNPYDTAALGVALEDNGIWSSATVSNAVSGVLAANCAVANSTFADPVTGRNFLWSSPKTRLFAYRGYMYMEGGKTYVFGSRFANFVRLVVDGVAVIDMAGVSLTDGRGTFTPPATGWYAIDARIGRNSNTYGIDGDGVRSWTSFGLAFNADGIEESMPESNWTPLMDDGSGSLLRPAAPAARTLSLTSRAVANGALTLTGTVGPGETPATAYVVYGEAVKVAGVGKVEELNGCTVQSLGSVAASADATAVSATVAGWGTSALVARLALVTDGGIAWTEPVAYTATALPILGNVVADAADGDTLAVSCTVSGGTAPYTAKVLVGVSADALEAVNSVRVNAAGALTVSATHLSPGTTIYWQLSVADATGAKTVSDVNMIALPGASRLYQQSLDGSDYNTANPVTAAQRTLTLGGTLSVLGAGDTWVGLLYGTWYPSEPDVPAYTTPFHEGDLYPVSSAGRYTVVKTFEWDQSVRFNWMVTNTNGRASWNTWRPANAGRAFVVADVQTYTWKGGARGEWTAASSWQDEGIWEDNAGYPRRGSGARFPAGTTNVVVIGDSTDTHGSDHRFSQLFVEEGANVTFSTKPGASTRLTLVGEGDAVPSRTFTLDLRQDATLTFSNCLAYVNSGNVPFRKNGSADQYGLQATGVGLRVVDDSTVTLGSGSGGESWRTEDRADTTLLFQDSTVKLNGSVKLGGARSAWVIDNARVTQSFPNDANDNAFVNLRASSKNGEATLVLKGAHPVLKVGKRVFSDDGETLQYIDFVVPEGGWREAAIQTHPGNTTRTFGCNMSGLRRLVLRVPADSPAVLAGETLDVPLVNWPAGIDPTYVTLDAANLPHPATDTFYTTTEPTTGNTVLWAHLVGQAESSDPQATDFRQTAATANGATITFMAIPGSGATGASATATVLDAAGEIPIFGASALLSPDSIDAAGVVTATVSGLDAGIRYTLSVTLTDTGDNNAATATYSFWTVGDYGEGSSADATSVATDGPFTVWTFTDSATAGQTLTVTKPGYADILIVGGG
ncbi:MAG: hypothetical protein IJQ73_17215, partial [Kiritimatiellae bacterium]|nr:hypothetical protein [Kiritimatiellia bacterium]